MRLDAESRKRVRLAAWGLVIGVLVFGVGGALSQGGEETTIERHERLKTEESAFFEEQAAELCGGEAADYEWWRTVGHPYDQNQRIGHIKRPSDGSVHVVSWYVFHDSPEKRAHQTGRLWDHWCDVEVPPGEMDE